MNYQVLALKWRPRTFAQMVGQQHIVRALSHALTQQRLHHAYLFTGTRGVGKTTLARILAKCLNCESGITATPCGECHSCQSINAGNSIDLIEVDAASRTRVEDTRDLLDNVPYAPTSSRYKIYLIDEVHMLSGHSFNALLKTLEEPPAHVKFILATTDPQKMPITVLSRCLQFHLKNLTADQISGQLTHIMQTENLSAEPAALQQLALAANGSMRDSLSLLDQAIAFADGNVTTASMQEMLGDMQTRYFSELATALLARDNKQVRQVLDALHQHAPDYDRALEQLLTLLHNIALAKQWPDSLAQDLAEREAILQLAESADPEMVQLLYQIGIIGRRDLALAPTPTIGFEMVVLRMLAFTPASQTGTLPEFKQTQQTNNGSSSTTHVMPNKQAHVATTTSPMPTASAAVAAMPAANIKAKTPANPQSNNSENIDWSAVSAKLNITGLTRNIAEQCAYKSFTDDELQLYINAATHGLVTDTQIENLQNALSDHFAKPIRVAIELTQDALRTPATDRQSELCTRQASARELIKDDENIKQLQDMFGAKVRTETIEIP